MRIVQLTDLRDRPIWVNVEAVTHIRPRTAGDGGAWLHIRGIEDAIAVRETPEAVVATLDGSHPATAHGSP